LFEAFVGAYFLNFGLEQTTALILPLIRGEIPEIMRQFTEMNVKNELQELLQAEKSSPVYRMVREDGPPHDRTFMVEVLVRDRILGAGSGKSIKEAQNHAAAAALNNLKSLPK
jgi:ribonuclease-3